MALPLSPRLLRRGLELFAVISLLGVVGLLLYGDNFHAFWSALLSLRLHWLIVGLALASMDWFGGGTRLWVMARHVHPGVRWKDMVISGGVSAWGAYLTPFQSGARPMMMWTMTRVGVTLPEAMTSAFMTIAATIAFFAISGPLALVFGAGQSLAQHNVVLNITLYDLFRTSLKVFVVLGVVMLATMAFPRHARDLVQWLAGPIRGRDRARAPRLAKLRAGIDRAHDCMVVFRSPRGWLSLLWAVLLSAPSHANKLLAGYGAMRDLGLPAKFLVTLL